MNYFKVINMVAVVVASIIIVICCIGIIIASKFQEKQKKKLNQCINIIKERGIETLQVKNGMSEEEIKSIDKSVSVNELMRELYYKYVKFEDKIKSLDNNLDDLLTGFLKDYYINKINNFKEKGYEDVVEDINLIGYDITEFTKDKLKFRVNINCFQYKKINGIIVSGSNVEKIEQVLILAYEKINENWLISNYEKVYEKKLDI